MKECSICKSDISHKKSNRASKCEKCIRIPNEKTLTKIKARAKSMSTTKREILTAYNCCCVICGWKLEQKYYAGMYLIQAGCEIHHIEKVSEGGKDVFDNCILLCPNHHKEADLGIIDKDTLLSYVIKDKESAMQKRRISAMCNAANLLDSTY